MNFNNLINDNGYAARNQYVAKTSSATYFKSYDSVVCKWDGINLILSRHWNYSVTTSKHLYMFLRQNGFYTFNSAKDIRKGIKNGKIILVEIPSLEIV